MSEVSTDKKLKGKDLITIGIFSAIYFVINFAFMLLGGIHPVLWMLMPGFIAVFAGIPFMLMVAKVQKLGAVFLMGLITALIYFVTGQFTLVILISMASTCILAEVVRAVTKYNSFKGNSIAYVIFSLGMVGSPLPIWLFKADFLAQITEQGMPADYVAAVEALSSNAMLIVLFVAPIIGGIIGALTIHLGGVPISLSTSGGALLSGLFFGWLRTKHPTFGRVPEPAVWIFNNLGLNMFIAVIGITAGPTFLSGIREAGFMLFIAGVLATTIPLLLGLLIGAKVFKFRPAINLGCCAGARTTTAALGAIQESLGSTLPAMGYTVTYAIGNTLLILGGVVLVLLSA